MRSCNLINKFFRSNLFRYQIRIYSKTVEALKEKTQPKIKRKSTKTHIKELNEYLSSTPHLSTVRNKLPERCLKKNRKIPDDLYLIDKKIGTAIADTIIPYLENTKGVIIETNPGLGFVTEPLLKAKLKMLHIYEPTVLFRDQMFKLNDMYPDKMKIYNKDFFSIWKLSYQDKYDNGNRVKNMLSGVPMKEWDGDVAMDIIGVLSSSHFLRHLLLSLIFQYGIMTYGRCNLYLCLSPVLYNQWTSKPKNNYQMYRASSVLFQNFCNFELIEKFPRKAFLPWDSTKEIKMNSKTRFPQFLEDIDYLYFTKISFKPLPVPVEKLQHLWFFVRHLMVSRKNKVIPMLEKWIPESGWELISMDPLKNPELYKNISIYTKIGDMSPEQILYLYKLFSSWPEYLECPFMATMENALLKLEQGTELDMKIKDDDQHEEEIESEENVQK